MKERVLAPLMIRVVYCIVFGRPYDRLAYLAVLTRGKHR